MEEKLTDAHRLALSLDGECVEKKRGVILEVFREELALGNKRW